MLVCFTEAHKDEQGNENTYCCNAETKAVGFTEGIDIMVAKIGEVGKIICSIR